MNAADSGFDEHMLAGKVALITGGTRGIGSSIAEGLSRRGAYVTIVGREEVRARHAANRMNSVAYSGYVAYKVADLSVQGEVERLAGQVREENERLDILVNNAGAAFPDRAETSDGIEMTLAVNHLAPFLLTSLLLPTLAKADCGRVVNVSTQMPLRFTGNLSNLETKGQYNGFSAYSLSKLANLSFTLELARRLEAIGSTRVTVNAVNPGIANTSLARDEFMKCMNVFDRTLMALAWSLISDRMTAQRASAAPIFVASSPDLRATSGKYFAPDGRETKPHSTAADSDVMARVWQVSERLTDFRNRMQGGEHLLHALLFA